MKTTFELAHGSVLGRSHQLKSRNNQDASYILSTDTVSICIVCDGCSDGSFSDVGAALCAPLIAQSIQKHLNRLDTTPPSPLLWQRVQDDILARILLLAEEMGDRLGTVIGEYFLFTIVGVVITEETTVFFSIGDGVHVINGDHTCLGPYPGNAPPYLAYNLLGTTRTSPIQFTLNRVIPTELLETFVVGSDGVAELIRREGHKIPGRDEVVPPLSHFWEQNRYFHNPDQVRRTLAGFNREVAVFDQQLGIRKEHGLLLDDTTLIVGRRRPEVSP